MAVSVLINTPKVLYIIKRGFLQLSFFHSDE